MKKMLVLVALLLVASLSFAAKPKSTNVNFTFDGFCDGMELIRANGVNQGLAGPQVLISGVHDLSACGLPSSLVGGLKHGLSRLLPPFNTPVDDVGDPIETVLYGIPYNLEYVVTEAPALPCTWAGYISLGSYNLFFNGGTCTPFAGAKVKMGRTGAPSMKR